MGDMLINNKKFGFIALTESQAQPYFKNTYDYLNPKFFSEQELTTSTINRIITLIKEINLLKSINLEFKLKLRLSISASSTVSKTTTG
jgi:hypothetical protein